MKADVLNRFSFKGYREWIKNKIDPNTRYWKKKILASKLRFRGTFSEDLFLDFSLDNSWVSTVKVDRIRSSSAKLEKSILRIESNSACIVNNVMVRSTWSMSMIFRLPALTWRKQVQSFPLLLRTLLSHKYFINWTIIEWGSVWCEESDCVDRGGACHRLGTTFIGLKNGNRVSVVRI